MWGGLKQGFKKRVQNLAGIREAIRSLRQLRSEVERLHRRLDTFDHRQHVSTQMLLGLYPQLSAGMSQPGIDRAGETLSRLMPEWQSAVFRSPDVEDCFEFIPAQKTLGDYAAFADAVTDAYEEAKVVVLERAPLVCDRPFLAQLEYPAVDGARPQDWATKELTCRRILEPYHDGHPLSRIFGKREDAVRYQEQVRSVNEQLATLARTLFASYRFEETEEPFQWRFALTAAEDMHLDGLKKHDDLHRVRMFVNIDSVPRVWSVGPSVDQLLERYGDALLPARDLGDHADQINLKLSVAVYGGLDKATRDLHPRHVAFLAPGSIWFANSSVLAHQAVFGRRVILGTLATRPECMRDPTRSFVNRVRRYAERRATPAA